MTRWSPIHGARVAYHCGRCIRSALTEPRADPVVTSAANTLRLSVSRSGGTLPNITICSLTITVVFRNTE